jgi:hypothetical protein
MRGVGLRVGAFLWLSANPRFSRWREESGRRVERLHTSFDDIDPTIQFAGVPGTLNVKPTKLSSHFRRNPGTPRPAPLEAEARNVGGTNCSTKPQHQKAFAQETAEKTGQPKRDIKQKIARAEATPGLSLRKDISKPGIGP